MTLVSFGGSALITTLFCIGVLLNIAARKPVPQRPTATTSPAVKDNRRRAARVVVADAEG